MKKNSLYVISILCLLSVFFACTQRKIKTTKKPGAEKTAFYDLKFKYDSINKKSNISINSIKLADVKINYSIDEAARQKPSYVWIEITDSEGNQINACIEHPLYRKFDVYDESGKIESKLVSLTEADMTIRVPYYAPYKKIKLTETINGIQTMVTVLKNEK